MQKIALKTDEKSLRHLQTDRHTDKLMVGLIDKTDKGDYYGSFRL